MSKLLVSPSGKAESLFIVPFPFLLQQGQQQQQIMTPTVISTTKIINKTIKTDKAEKGRKLAFNFFPSNPVYITKYHILSSSLGISY